MAQKIRSGFLLALSLCIFLNRPALALAGSRPAETGQALDQKVKNFLDSHRYSWRDMNVPEADGQVLYDLIIKNKYKKALEIGTSTGHSAIWMAWALSKTGGRLITVEIDEGRYREALANFEEAGLSAYIDARLADAHELVEELPGPFDFAFIDADKDWYVNYAKAVIPKLEAGGCLTAHNVYASRPGGRGGYRRGGYGGGDYYEFMTGQPGFETFVHPEGAGGLAVSYKKKQ
jgi:predicted O-methyltransferase YrrM